MRILSPAARNLLFWALFWVNVLGFLWGTFFFYPEQLAQTSPLLLLFVPDCPLAALLFAAALLLVRFAPGRYDLFNFLAFVVSLKYGFWTVFVLTAYPEFYSATPLQALMSDALIVAHVWLFFQAFLLASLVRVKHRYLVPVLGLMLLSDYSDYVWLTHPSAPDYALPLLFPFTVAMSVFFTLAGYWVLRKAKRPLLPLLAPPSR
ncbi:MAG: DUF1405 domain-containing protein [Candidatus Burarchaeum sp.]|nr:DUF1405 domain-containing protein [Candidatus Burarchaeum sp.]MDO8339715.1 DUF1405 domain-containing protein [Candidatus Burarchaeum sp.]